MNMLFYFITSATVAKEKLQWWKIRSKTLKSAAMTTRSALTTVTDRGHGGNPPVINIIRPKISFVLDVKITQMTSGQPSCNG